MGRTIDLISLFEEIPSIYNSQQKVFSCKRLTQYDKYFLAKNQFGSPVLLIEIKNVENLADIKLENLIVLFNKSCQIQIDEQRTKSVFTIINLESENKNLKNHFLRLVLSLIEYLGNYPNQKTLQKEIINFIELFKAILEPAKKTTQGLWAELFIIHQAKQKSNLIKAWHNDIFDKIDFHLDGELIEVKSSSNRQRIHHFSIDQLRATKNQKLFIASVFVEKQEDGLSIAKLLKLIELELNDVKELYKVKNTILKTLGKDTEKAMKIQYNFELAKSSLVFYNSLDVPTINKRFIPSQILEVKLKIDLSSIKKMYNMERLQDELIKFW